MESYCVFLAGNFIALPAFAKRYGVWHEADDKWIIESQWQSALQMGGPLGAFIGVFLAGPLTSKIGYRWATISALMALNGFIFVFYFGDSLGVLLASQLLEGLPWGIFIANAPAYCSEIVPIPLRAPATQMLQMFWAIGAIIVGAITYVYHDRDDQSAFRYVRVHIGNDLLTNKILGFPLHSSGCFPPRSRSSFGLHPSRLGGWFERDASKKRQRLSDAWDVSRWSATSPSLSP